MTDQASPPPTPSALPPAFDPRTINYRALTEPVSASQLRAFKVATRAAQRADPSSPTGLRTATSVVSVIGLVVGFAVFAPIALVTLIGSIVSSLSGNAGSVASGVVYLVIFALGLAAITAFAVSHFRGGGQWSRWMRLTRFAADNGLRFRTRSGSPNYQGMIFSQGDTRFEYDHLNSTTGRYFDFGNYQYSTGSGRSRSTTRWGFVALQLDRKLPNMVLDAKANNAIFGISNLPITLRKDQVLSLEGNFNDYFTLYCPKEYETDALYVFTPDLMALLIDDATSFDVEIVDDWMFVYKRGPFHMLDTAALGRVFTIVATVGAKAVSQTENYHDDRVGSRSSNIVAPQGQRLRHGVSLVGIIVVVLAVGGWLFGTINSMFGSIH